jgi:hypothetical protein
MTFLNPVAFPLLVLAAAAAAAVVTAALRRTARARALGFSASRVQPASIWLAVAVIVLVALAATQPAVLRSVPERSRTDVQVWEAIDTSNSMLASAGAERTSRLVEARRDALALRRRIGDLKVGLAVMTNRVLPLLPPTADADTFAAVDAGSVKPNTPRPLASDFTFLKVSTGFDKLDAVPQLNFYGKAKRKLLVLFSDMETTGFNPLKLQQEYMEHHVGLVLVQVGSGNDRVWTNGHEDPSYRPLRSAGRQVKQLAAGSAGGRMFRSGDMAAVASRIRELAGHGPTSTSDTEHSYLLVAPFLLLATAPLVVYLLVLSARDLRARLTA